MIKARTRRFLALGGVLALGLTMLAGGPYEPEPPTNADAIGPPSPRSVLNVPPPTHLATNGVPGCVRGSNRPVVHTVRPTLQATWAAPVPASFELVPLDGSAESTIGGTDATAGRPVIWETGQAWQNGASGLEPGRTYRWRTTGAPLNLTDDPPWSPWCEFTIAADLVDLRPAIDVDTVQELRVDPVRRYPVTLPVRQWRLALDTFDPEDEDVTPADGRLVSDEEIEAHQRGVRLETDIRARIAGRAAGRPVTMVLTGNDWAYLASAAASWAAACDERYEEEPETGRDGPKYWTVLDRMSAQLGGPRHPLRAE